MYPLVLTRIRCGLIFTLLVFSLCVHAQSLPDPKRFEDAIVAFETADKTSPMPEGAIVLTGSSSIARWNNQAQAALP
jgi:hypothetical protein